MRRLGPINQRRLTARIKEVYKGEFEDWYALTLHLASSGLTRTEIRKQFEALGICISEATLSTWISNRERLEARKKMLAEKQSENAA